LNSRRHVHYMPSRNVNVSGVGDIMFFSLF
jgi:hypothetical protein